jgi:two-component system NtrC family response regulator
MRDETRVLIVDDEPNIRSGLARGLRQQVDAIDTAASGAEAINLVHQQQYQLAIVDVRLQGDVDGLELISQILKIEPATACIVITAHGTVETAVEAMRRGAFDFITKPVDLNLIRQQVGKAIEHHRLRFENRQLRDRLADAGEISGIVGNCSVIQDVYRQIRQVADTDATVMIHGESGTGKELVARALHDLSGRCQRPFVAVSLGALPESLLESELFGHEKGAFSGATRRKPGCFEQASGGTLFLDEVTEMSPKSQVDLLRVLETGNLVRVGGEESLYFDARIISATNRDVRSIIDDGTFREDLYYRLNVVPIQIPSLRERPTDIPLLVEHFLKFFCQRHRRDPRRVTPAAMAVLAAAHWPGNVRQLRNVIERMVVTVATEVIDVPDLPRELTPSQTSKTQKLVTLAEATEAAERQAIDAALTANDYHRERAAKVLGISIRSLHYKMNRYGLH